MQNSQPTVHCEEGQRRRSIMAAPNWNGLDYVDVDESQVLLTVYFLNQAPKEIQPENVLVLGGRRITGIRVERIHVCRAQEDGRDDCMQVWVDRPGDFSTYRLCLVEIDEKKHPVYEVDELGRIHYKPLEGFDPRYACVDFSFKVNCPSDLDCATAAACPPETRDEPEINYLAKDYASFRQSILDRLALTLPDWRERHVPDIGITLVELLAYTGDYLSYYQDAVATEAYLDTSRKRISVRRHARLVDYAVHEGCNARTWVCVETDAEELCLEPGQFYFTTPYTQGIAARRMIAEEELRRSQPGPYEAFEPLRTGGPDDKICFYQARNRIRFYTWGETDCCLPAGTTSATLYDGQMVLSPPEPSYPPEQQSTVSAGSPAKRGPKGAPKPSGVRYTPPPEQRTITYQRELHLKAGDFLLFEEVRGAKTGVPSDANPGHRHVVRLTRVVEAVDELYRQPVLEVEWSAADALPFPLCISSRGLPPECALLEDVSVACGNLVLVDHGLTVPGEPLGTVPVKEVRPVCDEGCPDPVEIIPGRFTPVLDGVPLAFYQPLPEGTPPASRLLAQDPRRAIPTVRLQGVPPAPGGQGSLFTLQDLQDIDYLEALSKRMRGESDGAAAYLLGQLTPETRGKLMGWSGEDDLPPDLVAVLIAELEGLIQEWWPRPDLLGSGSQDPHFVVEIDDEGKARLRFGDGDLGRRPSAGTAFYATYRTGNGPDGNIGAEAIHTVVLRDLSLGGVRLEARNPFPAVGGTRPETLAEAKLFAPHAFRSELQRAVTPQDYADLVMRRFAGRVQRCAARLRWTGSWYEVWVAVDAVGMDTPEPALLEEIESYLRIYRRIGHDLVVRPAQLVPLDIQLTVCVLPNTLRGHVKAELLGLFGSRRLPGGRLGYFHPDNLTFGEGVKLSRLVALARSIPGVENVIVDVLQRYGEPPSGEIENGILPLGPFEIARLDNDPSFPENGRLKLILEGGR